MSKFTTLPIEEENIGERLDTFLGRKLEGKTFNDISKMLRSKLIYVESASQPKITKIGYRLQANDKIFIYTKALSSTPATPKPKPTNLELSSIKEQTNLLISSKIFESDGVLVINKPVGLASQDGSGVDYSVDSIIQSEYFIKQYGKYRLTHRLDRETSGVFVIAKNLTATRIMGDIFSNKMAQKTYLTIVKPIPKEAEFTVDLPLDDDIFIDLKGYKKQDQKRDLKMRAATTKFTVIAQNQESNLALVIATPSEGRKHQIRKHLSLHGSPIVNDKRYRGDNVEKSGMILHCLKMSIAICEPLFSKEHSFIAGVSSEMHNFIKKFFSINDVENYLSELLFPNIKLKKEQWNISQNHHFLP